MKGHYKLMTASALGILLSLGLCGVDARFISHGNNSFGGSLSTTGIILFTGSFIAFVSSCIAALMIAIRDHWSSR